MVVADPEATLLTVCANGYGKRTPSARTRRRRRSGRSGRRPAGRRALADEEPVEAADEPADGRADGRRRRGRRGVVAAASYRTQRRGGKGLRDIKTTERNGPVIGIVRVDDDDELLMMTARGKIQRIAASDISIIGRNTQGVRIMSLDEDDTLVAVVRVPKEEEDEADVPTVA